MKIETYKKRFNFKTFFIGVVVAGVVLIPITVNVTKAKFSTSETTKIAEGTIKYTPYDFKIMAMYQDNGSGGYAEINKMPSSGYVINEEKSYCYTTDPDTHDTSVELKTVDGNHVFNNLSKSSKCYLWFDEKLVGSKLIIANAESTTTMPSITGISSDTSNTLYTVEDDDGNSYVFRGNPSNNWVKFAGFYWRIIRVNGDGTIRMIYNGISADTTGVSTQISNDGGTTTAYVYNSNSSDNAYVGFMYGEAGASTYDATHTNTNKSSVMKELETWYSSNMTSYTSYIDTNAGFCNDREPITGAYTDTSYDTLGYGTNATAYAPLGRLYQNDGWRTTQVPSLKCTNKDNDLFTMGSATKGNKKLTYPVGLITSDEIVFAGGFGGMINNDFYLYNGRYYWTMSPRGFDGTNTNIFLMYSNGTFSSYYTYSTFGIRPVINLRSDVTFSGDGTTSSPYEVS